MQTHKWEFIACDSEEQSLNWEMYSKLAITSLKLAILKEKKVTFVTKSASHNFFIPRQRKKSQNCETKSNITLLVFFIPWQK